MLKEIRLMYLPLYNALGLWFSGCFNHTSFPW